MSILFLSHTGSVSIDFAKIERVRNLRNVIEIVSHHFVDSILLYEPLKITYTSLTQKKCMLRSTVTLDQN